MGVYMLQEKNRVAYCNTVCLYLIPGVHYKECIVVVQTSLSRFDIITTLDLVHGPENY